MKESWCRLQISILHGTAPVYPSIQRCWLGCSDRPSPRKNSIRVLLHQTLCYFVRAQAPGDATSSWRAARQLLTRKMSRAALRPTPSAQCGQTLDPRQGCFWTIRVTCWHTSCRISSPGWTKNCPGAVLACQEGTKPLDIHARKVRITPDNYRENDMV